MLDQVRYCLDVAFVLSADAVVLQLRAVAVFADSPSLDELASDGIGVATAVFAAVCRDYSWMTVTVASLLLET